MRLLGEIIYHHGMHYHQYTDDIQLYISIPTWVGDAIQVHAQFLKAVRDWIGRNQLRFFWGKNRVALCFWSLGVQ